MERKFDGVLNFGITRTMCECVQELCGPQSPFTQSDIGRMAVHEFLLPRSEKYRRAMGIAGMNGGVRNG